MKRKILVVAAVVFTTLLHAQQDSISQLDNVSVTATRFPKKLSETGKIVSIITQEELNRQGGKDIAQILNQQSGIIIAGANSNPGKEKAVYLNGANYGYTLILLNGVPVIDPTGVGGAFDLRMIPVEQVERIEILKGAQSTLYGSDAVAGVINIITKKGYNKPANIFGGLSYGSHASLKASAGVSGAFQNSSYNIGLVHSETKGISEAVNERDTSIRNGLLQNAMNLNITSNVAKNFSVKPFLRYAYYKGSIPDDAFMPANNPYTSSILGTGSQFVYDYAKGSATALIAVDDVKRNYNFSYGAFAYHGYKKTAELFGTYHFSNYFMALAGLRHDRISMKLPTPTVPDTSLHITSPYVSLFLKNLKGFHLEVGGRLNQHSKYGSNFTYNINPSYLIHEQIKLFVNYGTAFRAPSLTELFGQFGANPDLKPETAHTLQGGVQLNALQERFTARAYYFNRRIKDVITYNSSFVHVNYNRQKDHGFEVETDMKLTGDLSVKLFYNFVEGEVTVNNNGTDSTYNNLFRRPKHSGGAALNYQITPRLFAGTNVQFYGKRYELFADPRNSYATSVVALTPYTIWDAYAQYSVLQNRLTFFTQANNILNQNFQESVGYATLGRTFTGGFRFHF